MGASPAPLQWRVRWEAGSVQHAPIPPPPHPTFDLSQAIRGALEEDAGVLGDITTAATISGETQAVGTFLAKDDGVLAGLAVADLVFEIVDQSLQVKWSAKDGDSVRKGTKFGNVHGSAASILVAERIALNFMQRMSGTATATAAMVAETAGYQTKIIETRKTVPGLRLLDKWAVLIGGGDNHRMGLYDMMMIKDNHVTAAGGITNAVSLAQDYIKNKGLEGTLIEVETRTLDEVREVLQLLDENKAGAVSRIMLDNMMYRDSTVPGGINVDMMRAAVDLIAGRLETEASGNVTKDTVRIIAATGVSHISSGALTHSVKAFDISLKIETV